MKKIYYSIFTSCCAIIVSYSSSSQEVIKFASRSQFVTQINDGIPTSVVLEGVIENIDFKLLCMKGNLLKIDMSRVIGTRLPVGAFKGLETLQEVVLPPTLTHIDSYSFYGCRSLSVLCIPQGVQIIGSHVFQDCKNLQQVTIGSSIQSMGSLVFSGCVNLLVVKVFAVKPPLIGDMFFSKGSKATLFVAKSSVKLYADDRSWKGYFGDKKSRIKPL